MSNASREREAIARMKPVKFFVVGMTPGPEGKSQVSFFSDMSIQEIQAIIPAMKGYLEQRLEKEMQAADKILVFPLEKKI